MTVAKRQTCCRIFLETRILLFRCGVFRSNSHSHWDVLCLCMISVSLAFWWISEQSFLFLTKWNSISHSTGWRGFSASPSQSLRLRFFESSTFHILIESHPISITATCHSHCHHSHRPSYHSQYVSFHQFRFWLNWGNLFDFTVI